MRFLLPLLAACSRTPSTTGSSTSSTSSIVAIVSASASSDPVAMGTPAASAAVSVSTTPAASVDPYLPVRFPDEPSFTEARRGTLQELGYLPYLSGSTAASVLATLKKRFGDDLATLSTQSIALPAERRAIYVHRATSGLMPVLVVLDSNGSVAWAREQALGGIHAGIDESAMASGPDGEVLVAFHDPVSRVIGARRWASDGTRIMDLVMLEEVGCDAFSLLRWPGHGWLAITSSRGAIRAQLIDERGHAPWGNSGRAMTSGWIDRAPVSAVLDTDESALLFFHGFTPGTSALTLADSSVLAQRIDANGALKFPSPLVVGRTLPMAPTGGAPRVGVARAQPGRVEVTLLRGSIPEVVDVTSAGAIVLR